MKKRLLALLLTTSLLIGIVPAVTLTADDVDDSFAELSAHELVSQMKTGWNLGNTFDAWQGTSGTGGRVDIIDIETMWLGGRANQTTQSLIKRLKAVGFDTIRIPVTWFKVANRNDDWKIRDDWMARVKEVVDWAVEEDMFVIINSHHDDAHYRLNTGDASDPEHYGNIFLTNIWKQIAETFKDYDEKMIFETLNEPRTPRSSQEWGGGTAIERANLNRLNQVILDTIRASGGNNEHRIIMTPTYAASANNNALMGYELPDDSEHNPDVNKIILSVHTYSPFSWAHDGSGTYSGKNAIINDLNRVRDRAQTLGIPVVLGEWGSIFRSEPASDRERHADDYITAARERGMVAVWWDDGGNFALINRQSPHGYRHPNANIMRGILRGLGGHITNTNDSDVVKGNWFHAGMENGEFIVKGLFNEWCSVYGANYSQGGVYGYELEILPAANADFGDIHYSVSMGGSNRTYTHEGGATAWNKNNVIITRWLDTNNLLTQNGLFKITARSDSMNFRVVSVTFLGQSGQKLSTYPIYFYANAKNSWTFDKGNFIGNVYGWDIETWNESTGDLSMTINRNGTFNGSWEQTSNSLFRSGKKFARGELNALDLKDIIVRYRATKFEGTNTSYLCVYGWLEKGMEVAPVEWYIIDNWLTYRPGGANPGEARPGYTFHGTIATDGGVYDIYTAQRVEKPSINKDKDTFTQIFSVRHDKRLTGTINVAAHFAAWNEKTPVDLNGYNLYEVSLTVEGYGGSAGSSGSAVFDAVYLKYGNVVKCSHIDGAAAENCPWCAEPCDGCKKRPCACRTFRAKIIGGSWSIDNVAVTGDEVSPRSNSINPELIKAVRFTFDMPGYKCGIDENDPSSTECPKNCMAVAALGGGGIHQWTQHNFCYKEQQVIFLDLEALGWDPAEGWLKLGAACWIPGNDGTVLVEVLGENGKRLRWGQQVLDEEEFTLGLITKKSQEDGKPRVADALEILKELVGMRPNYAEDNPAAWITPQSAKDEKPAVRDALEILKELVGMDGILKEIFRPSAA